MSQPVKQYVKDKAGRVQEITVRSHGKHLDGSPCQAKAGCPHKAGFVCPPAESPEAAAADPAA